MCLPFSKRTDNQIVAATNAAAVAAATACCRWCFGNFLAATIPLFYAYTHTHAISRMNEAK